MGSKIEWRLAAGKYFYNKKRKRDRRTETDTQRTEAQLDKQRDDTKSFKFAKTNVKFKQNQ